MALAHAGAEKVRGMAGYSGGSEGTAYHTPSIRAPNAAGGTLSAQQALNANKEQTRAIYLAEPTVTPKKDNHDVFHEIKTAFPGG